MIKQKVSLFIVLGMFSLASCNNALVIKDVNYAQYVESVLIPDDQDIVHDYRNSISFSILPIKKLEVKDSQIQEVSEIRLIRNSKGYYFITADQFKNVYVFEPKNGTLKLKESIAISENGLKSPVFNWRDPYIEILSNNKEAKYFLSEKGIITENEKEGES